MKKGDRVRIREDSEHFGQTHSEEIGTVTRYDDGMWYYVEFDNGYSNYYRKKDLELVKLDLLYSYNDLELAAIKAFMVFEKYSIRKGETMSDVFERLQYLANNLEDNEHSEVSTGGLMARNEEGEVKFYMCLN